MILKQHPNPIHPVAASLFLMILLMTLSCLGLSACTSKRHLSSKDQKSVYLEKELAEANQRIEELYHRLSVIQFMVDNHEKAIKDMEKSPSGKKRGKEELTSNPPLVTNNGSAMETAMSQTPEDLYNQAREAYTQKDYNKAGTLFSALSKNYPHHDLADNAIYWHGECFYSEKHFEAAIGRFKEMLNTYPESNKAPDAMLKIGYAYLSIGDRKNGKLYLKKVTRSYPFSNAAPKATSMLKTLND